MSTIAKRVATRFARIFPTPKALNKYLERHPDADRSKHKVEKRKHPKAQKPQPEKPQPKAKTEDKPKRQFSAYKPTSKEAVVQARGQAKNTKWERPTLEEEGAEVERTAKSLGIPVKKMMQAWNDAEVEPLGAKDWSRLENTDSYDTDTFEKVDEKAQEYDRDLSWTVARMGKTLPSPIVLFRKGKPPYLVGGNTRLMASRALGAKPSVLALRID